MLRWVGVSEQLAVQLVHLPVKLKRLLQAPGVLVKLSEVARRLNREGVLLANADVDLRQNLREKCLCGFVLSELTMGVRESFHR